MRGPPSNILIPGRGYAIRGLGIWKTVNGRPVFQRWPRTQKAAHTEGEARNRRLLRQAAIIAPYFDTYQQEFARELASKTQLAPRDFLFIAMFGRIGTFVRKDGTKIYSMAAMQDVSQILDALYQFPKGLLVRGEVWWEGLPPGALGQVLTINADGYPSWETQVIPAQSPIWTQPTISTFAGSTDLFATQGQVWQIDRAITIQSVMAFYVPVAGQTYKAVAALASLSGSTYTLTTVNASAIVAPNNPGFDTWQQFDLITPLAVPAFSKLFIGLTRTSATATTSPVLGQGNASANAAILPGRPDGPFNLASVNPAVGNVLVTRAATARALGLFYHE